VKNQIKVFLLLVVLTGFFMFIGGLVGGQEGVVIAFGLALLMNFISYWKSDKIVLTMFKATPVNEQQMPELYDMVKELAQKAYLPMPRVYVIPEGVPNAFATGRNPKHAVVAVTQGLLRTMNKDELRAVIAHELGHIKNRDILIATIAATFAGAIMFLASMMRYGALFGGGNRRNAAGAIPLILVAVLAPLGAMLIQMSISRSREYLADDTGAQISSTPGSLANALQKLDNYSKRAEPITANPATAHMFTVSPLSKGNFTSLFATHPPIAKRISRLRQKNFHNAIQPTDTSYLNLPKETEAVQAPIEEINPLTQKPMTPAEKAAQDAWRRISGK